jgi:hypothetical protein
MQKIAMILNDVVVNIAVWDGVSLWQPEGYTLVDLTHQPQVDMGYRYDAGTGLFSAPAEE